ncbi:MAG: AhpC/TSA family protein, partial [Alphaproteobacteria bacterium]
MLIPRRKTPALTLPLVGGGEFDLDRQEAERGTLLVVHRGAHCPICAGYLRELDRLTPEFEAKGVRTLALSTDTRERAEEMTQRLELKVLRMAYGLKLQTARDWGLYISTGRGKTSIGIEEPALFAEPGVFLVWADRTLYFASIQTMP